MCYITNLTEYLSNIVHNFDFLQARYLLENYFPNYSKSYLSNAPLKYKSNVFLYIIRFFLETEIKTVVLFLNLHLIYLKSYVRHTHKFDCRYLWKLTFPKARIRIKDWNDSKIISLVTDYPSSTIIKKLEIREKNEWHLFFIYSFSMSYFIIHFATIYNLLIWNEFMNIMKV